MVPSGTELQGPSFSPATAIDNPRHSRHHGRMGSHRGYSEGTESGRLHLKTKNTEGLSIDAYCDEDRLTIPERLGLFESVCQSVITLHTSLILHGDLRPENILVDVNGRVSVQGAGRPRKMLGEFDGSESTPELQATVSPSDYSAPEAKTGARPGIPSEVYSLGVILYELLSGARPHDGDGGAARELPTAGTSHKPLPPSERVFSAPASKGAFSSGVAYGRRLRPGQLKKKLSGDLDAICLKAMSLDPRDRYPSVHAFLEDLRRHAQGLPIEARPAGWSYVLKKGMSRNAVALWAVAILLVVASVLVAIYTARLSGQREQAQAEAVQASQVAAFVWDLLVPHDLPEESGEIHSVQDLLDRGGARIAEEYRDRPALQARLRRALGGVYVSRGDHSKGISLVEAALRQQREIHGETSRVVATTELDLAQRMQALGNLEAADAYFRSSLEKRKALRASTDAEIREAELGLASLREEQGDYLRAEVLYRDVLETVGREAKNEDSSFVEGLQRLGSLLSRLERYPEAEALLLEAHRILLADQGPEDPRTQSAVERVVTLYRDWGRPEQGAEWVAQHSGQR